MPADKVQHQGHQEHQGVPLQSDALARQIVDAGLKVHKHLGPGLLESVYEACLAREFDIRALPYQRQVVLPVDYQGLRLESGYRLDLIVADAIVGEIKAVETLVKLHEAQLLTYLRLSHPRVGFLMNFNVTLFKQGVRRLIL